ncbi:MAG TPA: NADH-quinone oxidoreductase subunit NuoE [Bacillota bacterium]|jgi:NADH-quinone oxidoreductase E subunit|nr:NADH-quinone oxidoreductase subunit NuoE [Bacillota bacterium]
MKERDENRLKQLDEVIESYKDEEGALIPVLQHAQEIFGYLPEDVQERIARGLKVPVSEVYGVATFYSLFSLKPVGQYRIGVCMGTACYVKGAADLLNKIETDLGIKVNETTQDERFTLEVTRCIGACGLAPVMTVNKEVYGRLTPDEIPDILGKYKD